jgi:hypothetical protein
MKDYWTQEWSYHVPFFNYIYSRDRFMQIFWMLQLSPKPPTTGSLTRTKTMLCSLKAIDANKKPRANLQFRQKLVRSYLQTGWQCGDQKSWVSNDGAERLGGKQHFVYTNETAIPKTVQSLNSKMKGGRCETVYYCATRSSKRGLSPGDCFEL